MFNQKRLGLLIVGLILALGATGCASVARQHKAAQAMAQKAAHKFKAIHTPKSGEGLTVTNKVYIASSGHQVHKKRKLPSVFSKNVSFGTSHAQPLSQVSGEISQAIGIPISVAPSAYKRPKKGSGGSKNSARISSISMHYNGPVKGLLNRVASQEGLFWHYENGTILFTRTKTRVFELDAIPGHLQERNQLQNSSQNGNKGGKTKGGQQGAVTNSTGGSGKQTIAMGSKKISFWKDIKATLKSMLSPYGSMSVSESSGMITVTDTPAKLDQVAAYVKQLNKSMRKQVTLHITVYSVQLKKSHQYGINWSAVFSDLAKKYSIGLAAPSLPNTSTTPGSLSGAILKTAPSKSNAAKFSGSSALAQALSTQGNTSLVTTASMVTLNNQPAPLQVSHQTGYLASIRSTQTVNVGSTQSLRQGKVTTGFSLDFLPHITGSGRILLQYALSLSSLQALKTVKSGKDEIQTPDISSQNFLQRVMMKSGQTLVLSGYNQTQGQANNTGLFSPKLWGLGGSTQGSSKHDEIVVVVSVRTHNEP